MKDLSNNAKDQLLKLAANKLTKKIMGSLMRTGKKNIDDAIGAARKSRHMDDVYLKDLADDKFIKSVAEKSAFGKQQSKVFAKHKKSKNVLKSESASVTERIDAMEHLKRSPIKGNKRKLTIDVAAPKESFAGKMVNKLFGGRFSGKGKNLNLKARTRTGRTKLQVGYAKGDDAYRSSIRNQMQEQRATVSKGMENIRGWDREGRRAGSIKNLPGTKPPKVQQNAIRKDVSTKVKVLAGIGLAGVGGYALGGNNGQQRPQYYN